MQKTKAKVLKIIREQVLWSFLIPSKVRSEKTKKENIKKFPCPAAPLMKVRPYFAILQRQEGK